jgi:hypothetical protein
MLESLVMFGIEPGTSAARDSDHYTRGVVTSRINTPLVDEKDVT